MPASRPFSREVSIYLVGFLGVGLIQFVGLPIYARVLGPELYGLFSLTTAVTTVLSGVMVVGGDVALARFWADTGSHVARRVLATTWIGFLTGWSVLVVLLAASAVPAVADALRPDADLAPLLLLGLAALVPTQLSRMLAQVLRNSFRPVAYASVLILNASLDVGLGLLFVLGFDAGVAGILLGIVVGETIGAAVRLVLVRQYLGARLQWDLLPPLLRFGVPFIPASLATWTFKGADRLVLGASVPTAALGHYGLAVSLVAPFAMVTAALGQAWLPRIAEIYTRDQAAARRTTGLAIEWALLGFGAVAALTGAFAPLIVRIVGGPQFVEAALVLPLLAFASVLTGMGLFTMTGLTLAKATRPIPLITAAAAVLNVVLLLVLVPVFGVIGAAASVAAASLVLALLSLRYANRVFPVGVSRRRISAAIVVLAGQAALCTARPDEVLVAVGTVVALAAVALLARAAVPSAAP